MMQDKTMTLLLTAVLLLSFFVVCESGIAREQSKPKTQESRTKTLNVLFIGNSYTARHDLADVVKAMAEAGNPELSFNPTQVIYGGRTLKDHWRLGTGHVVNRHSVTQEQVKTTIAELASASRKDSDNKYTSGGLTRMQKLLQEIESD